MTSEARPQGLDFLIQDFGNVIGMAELAFDEDGVISLELDGIEFDIQYAAKDWELIVRSPVDVSADQLNAQFALSLLAANAQSFALGDGILVFDADYEAMVAMNRIDARGMTVEQLISAVSDAVRAIRVWPERLAGLASIGSSDRPPAPVIDASATHFIKI